MCAKAGCVIDRTVVPEQPQQSTLSSMDVPTSSENIALSSSTNQPQKSSIHQSQAIVTSTPSDKAVYVNITTSYTTPTSSPATVSIFFPWRTCV